MASLAASHTACVGVPSGDPRSDGGALDASRPSAALDAASDAAVNGAIDAAPIPQVDGERPPPLDIPAPVVSGEWVNVTSNLAGLATNCNGLGSLGVKRDEDVVMTSVATHGLFSTRDGGESWQPMAEASHVRTDVWSYAFDPIDPDVFWISGIWEENRGLWRTDDGGDSFSYVGQEIADLTGNTWVNLDVVSVNQVPGEPRVLLAGYHEASGRNYRFDPSSGGGEWTNVGATLPAQTACPIVLVIDASTYLVGCKAFGWLDPPATNRGIFRTSDGGASWEHVYTEGVDGRAPLLASNGAIYWIGEGYSGLVRSFDHGRTWERVPGSSMIRTQPIELPDHRIAAIGDGSVVVSSDWGDHWDPATTEFPTVGGTFRRQIAYSRHRRAFFITHEVCSEAPIAGDAIWRHAFDWEG